MALDARESKVVEGTGLLEEELLRRNNELAALNAIAEAVSGSLDLDEVLNNALDKVLEITGFEAGGIGLVDEAQEIIVPTVYCGVPEAFLASLEQPRAGDGLRWRAVKSGESIFFEDIPHDPRIPKERRALVEGFYAAAYIPLKVKDRVVGLMGLGTRQEHRFTPENKVFLMTISNQIGIAIENARLYEATRQELAARKRAEEALRGRETFFSGTLNNLLTFIGVLEPDGKVIFVNNTPLDAAGIKVEDVIGKRFYDTYWWAHSEEARQTIRKDIERCASGETIVREIQAQMVGGSLMWVEFSMHPVYDEEGKVKYLVPEGRDITERKQAEEEVQRHLERLEA
ncbi:MAG: GAF domain-containing protein, partial [Anaerolineae bacterium]